MKKLSIMLTIFLILVLTAGSGYCAPDVILKPGNVWTNFGKILSYPVCLDNQADLVGGMQFDLCEYSAGLPNDCLTCTGCELTERAGMLDCAVLELYNGCCRVILFSSQGGVIDPGLCDVVKVVYEPNPECAKPVCEIQVPVNIIVTDNGGYRLPASGLRGEVCFLAADTDGDGIPDEDDNCPITPNGPNGGTCLNGSNEGNPCTNPGANESECGTGGFCSMNQEDLTGNGIGDVCECVDSGACDDGLWCNGIESCENNECVSGTDPCLPSLVCDEVADECTGCLEATECDDGLWCNGIEGCVNNECAPGNPPCDDGNSCTTDPCDEGDDVCLANECAAIGPADPCCDDPLCVGIGLCVAEITLTPEDVWVTPGEVVKTPVCLDNPDDLVGGIQFDLCEYDMDEEQIDCLECTDCELSERTGMFDCAVLELPNGCCRVILFCKNPSCVINPGLCDIITVVHEPYGGCTGPMCALQVPENIIASDDGGFQLPAYGLQGDVCFLAADTDGDGVPDGDDNCPITPNGPEGGTCVGGDLRSACMNSGDCVYGGFCSMNQEDENSNGAGDACECENNAECDDGLFCNGIESCVSNECVPGISPCDDGNPCTTDTCDEVNDSCLDKECVAVSPEDSCCDDPVCEGIGLCVAEITLNPGDVTASPGEIISKPVCLSNPTDLVGGIQFDLCEYSMDEEQIDCVECMDCELTGRTTMFDCAVSELPNGCCRVILFCKNPSCTINPSDPGLCGDIITVYEFHEGCAWQACTLQVPENIVAADYNGVQLPADGLPGEVCFSCTDNEDCDDGLFCNGVEICVDGICQPGVDPCDDANDCTNDICNEEDDTCSNICNATSFYDPCCNDPVCRDEEICISQVTIEPGLVFCTPGDNFACKKPICLDNPDDLIGGIQFDLCEYDSVTGDPIDCMTCADCELTERTTMFDCSVLELPNGCCRVLLFCKNPGCAINPGLCDIITVVYDMSDVSEDCPGTDCITQIPENIIVSDFDGYQLTASGFPIEVCPFLCGDVCPADDPLTPYWDCGDGVVDIYDMICEVDFALTAATPDDCQAMRADVPTGTPPDCIPPDGTINILDITVLIDMALSRQDCCTFYYTGVIY